MVLVLRHSNENRSITGPTFRDFKSKKKELGSPLTCRETFLRGLACSFTDSCGPLMFISLSRSPEGGTGRLGGCCQMIGKTSRIVNADGWAESSD